MPSRTIELPEHTDPLQPIHASHGAKIRSLHAQYPPPTLQRYLLDTIQDIAEASADFAERRRVILDEAENGEEEENDEQSEAVARLGKNAEDSVRKLLDCAEEGKHVKRSLQNLSERDRNRGNDGEELKPLHDYEQSVLRLKDEYNDRDLRVKYGNVAEYQEYRKLVHASSTTDAPFPNTRELLKTPLFRTRVKLVDEAAASAPRNNDEDEEEDFEITNITQSLLCPLTMRLFEDPVVSPCQHFFEKTAISEMFASKRRGMRNGQNCMLDCPTAGCARKFKESELADSPVMKRRVAQEHRRLERERENVGHETQNRRRKVGETLDMTNGDDEGDEQTANNHSRRSQDIAKIKMEKATQQGETQRRQINDIQDLAPDEDDDEEEEEEEEEHDFVDEEGDTEMMNEDDDEHDAEMDGEDGEDGEEDEDEEE